jgi:hypothetical protein
MKMQQPRLYTLCLLSLLFATGALSAASATAPSTFRVEGAVTKAAAWSVPQIERDLASEIKTLSYTQKGKKYSARCVPLLALIRASEPHYTDETKHPELRFLVKVQGRDGYSVWFSLAELLPEFGNGKVYIALDVNGEALSGDEAPVRLLVPGEKDHGRWIYGIASIVLVDGAPLKISQ